MAIKSGKNALFTEINITPLTDIFLVLLIIMMVVAPTFQSIDNEVNIPEINNGTSIEEKNATVSVSRDGKIYLNDKLVDISNLAVELEKIKPYVQKQEVVVRADEKTKSSVIMDIMDSAQEAQYKKLVVAGEPLTKKTQKMLEQQNEELINEEKSLN
jgi:biopolymer transport protein ExbD